MIKQLSAKIDGRGMEDNLEIIDAILEERGIEDLDEFLHPTEDDLTPFEKLKGAEEAAQVIIDAIDNNETFIIYYDNDLDGTTAGSIAYRYLKNYTDNIYTYIANKYWQMDYSYYFIAGVGIVLSLVGQIGDFAASTIKRFVDIKDYSNLIPAHGGMLDRIDSLIFLAPFAYALFTIL